MTTTAERLNEAVRLHQAGRLADARAIYQDILRARPDQLDALHLLGVVHYQQGAPAEAVKLIERAMTLAPESAAMAGNLGEAYRALGDPKRAEKYLRRATALDPNLADAHNNLGILLRGQDRLAEAAEAYRRALALVPERAAFHMNLAGVLRELGETEAARDHAERALELDPKLAAAHNLYANLLKDQGDIDQAAAHYRRAIALDPDYGQPYWNLANCRKYGAADRAEATDWEAMLERSDLPETTRIELLFALGKIHDDLGDYDRAFELFADANRRRRPPFDAGPYIAYIDREIAVYTRDFLASRRDIGAGDDVPVFIVGMIRSGTTLVEQILASHPAIAGAGELRDIALLTERAAAMAGTGRRYPEAVADLGEAGVRQLAEIYLTGLRRRFPGARRITDKMPANFLHLGFIQLLMPGARIIHCRRDPLDTCLSAFFQNFAEPPPFASDLEGLGTYYRHYSRLMDHWRGVLELPILEVEYEELVADTERISRQMVDFCGLEWDPSCLRYRQTARPVRTASSWQVRQPVYRSSVARWRHYEKQLAPLRAALGQGATMEAAP